MVATWPPSQRTERRVIDGSITMMMVVMVMMMEVVMMVMI